MKDNEIVIQSFLPHALEFRRDGEQVLLIPASFDERNIVIADKSLVEDLAANDKTFASAMEQHLIKLLNNVPVKYQDQADTLIQVRLALDSANTAKDEANGKLNTALSENEALKQRIAELEAGHAMPGIDPLKLKAAKEAAAKAAGTK